MSPTGFVQLGKIQSTPGVRGDVCVFILAGEAHWAEAWDSLHYNEENSNQPAFEKKILRKKPHKKQKKWGYVLSLEGVDTMEKAQALVGQWVFVPEAFLVSGEDEEIYLREVLGFQVKDETRGLVGTIKGFSGNDFQDLLVIKDQDGNEFEVPFVEPLLVEINKEDKTVLMDIPIGLVPGEDL